MPNRNLGLINVVLGLWVVVSSLLLWHRDTATSVNGWITGAVIVVSSLVAMRSPNVRFVSAAAGVWLVASLFAWPNYSSPVVWNNAIFGAAIALVSLVGPETADMITS